MTIAAKGLLTIFSREKRLSDQLFWMMFYLCVALLPPLISIIGRKALVLPLIILSLLVVLRFFMREDCRKRMIASIKTPAIMLLLAFTALHRSSRTDRHDQRPGALANPDETGRHSSTHSPTQFCLVAPGSDQCWFIAKTDPHRHCQRHCRHLFKTYRRTLPCYRLGHPSKMA